MKVILLTLQVHLAHLHTLTLVDLRLIHSQQAAQLPSKLQTITAGETG
jgi:hypothetical protein